MKKCCCTCKWLYIKDFVTGICDNDKSDAKIVNPSDTCENWEVIFGADN